MAAQPLWPDDPVDAIMRVMARAFDSRFGEAWNRRQVADALILGTSSHALIAPDGSIGDHPGNEPAGFLLARQALDEEELLLFAVDPAWRRRGLGAALLEHLCHSAAQRGTARIFLEMRDGNPAARLYEGHGFQQVGRRPGYYRGADGTRIDALTYQRTFV